MMAMDDPDLLYEDLFEDLEDGKAIIKTSLHEMEDRMKSLSNEAEELRLQVRNLQDQNDELSKQNEVLIRNISCLFKTAQMEISRKDKQIRSLQEESLKMNACNHGSPASTASTQAAADRCKPYLPVTTLQADHTGKRAEACTASGGMGRRGLHGGKHGEYSTMVSRGLSKDKMGETSLPSGGMGKQGCNGEWKPNNPVSAHCDHVAVALQTDCKGDTPLASDGMRRRGHHRSGNQDYTTMESQTNHKGRTKETPLASGGTEKRSHYEQEHCDYAMKTSQADHNGSSPLVSDGTWKQGDNGKSADLKLRGDCTGRLKEMPLESGYTRNLGHHDDKHGDGTAMASRADCKGSKETLSGMENQEHQRGDHCDNAGKHRSCGKGSEPQDEMWKRRRVEGEYVAAGKQYHRSRADERDPLDAKRGIGAINAYRSSDAHKTSERREKWNRT